MKVGSIHKNSKTRYFAVGGYFSYEEDRIKIKAKYKKENLKLKKEKNLGLDTEIEVDGGINIENTKDVKEAGATIAVSGTAILNSKDYSYAIGKMKE